ncbi:MAG TPA: prepilin-type N-terminal cleavage/methylation domain-containing protein [Candidatus Saccharimonadales bacterium]|nr:prepilin-type N-terminal cleavage/methylation domain-containing protein [Candidatus Saccharimonadales bacterium]
MGKQTQSGFTIIEVMLFLAVTGLLAVGILVGSGVAIGQQRYRDSVNSLKSFIQEQYSEVTNVINTRGSNWSCTAAGEVVEDSGQPRGTGECVLLGRLITVDDTGTTLTAANVVGYRIPGAATASSDLLEMKNNYRLGISPIDQETTEVAWGAQIVKPGAGVTPASMSILIIRSPLSGSLFTFTQDSIQSNLNNMIDEANLKNAKDLCVNADAGTFVGRRMEVRIDPYAASQSAVRIPVESESVCD